ncbi:MAG: protein-L-isoaspartate(D-aspartate) O-methyltransferase [Cytophagales bacterium]|nr:protein-L-isoaspartate(D-aspartate) O-methyltransferase [Cytophagales bacterium]
MDLKDNLEDSYRHRGMRKMLVKEVQQKGITSLPILQAIGKIPRHFFFENVFLEHAYEDKAFPIGQGQTISQPYTVAFQTQLLQVRPGNKILEIGTGSGYQACVLVELGAEVHTIEYNKVLFKQTSHFLPQLGYKPHFYYGDGSKGIPAAAPYDGIVVTAGAPSVPSALIEQLKIGGRLIIPVGNNKTQKMLEIQKTAERRVRKKEHTNFSFVPLLGQHGWNE